MNSVKTSQLRLIHPRTRQLYALIAAKEYEGLQLEYDDRGRTAIHALA